MASGSEKGDWHGEVSGGVVEKTGADENTPHFREGRGDGGFGFSFCGDVPLRQHGGSSRGRHVDKGGDV